MRRKRMSFSAVHQSRSVFSRVGTWNMGRAEERWQFRLTARAGTSSMGRLWDEPPKYCVRETAKRLLRRQGGTLGRRRQNNLLVRRHCVIR